MKYMVLTQDDQDEIMQQFLEAQERDLFCFRVNLERYDNIIKSSVSAAFGKRITQLRAETLSRIEEVEAIISASDAQIPPAERLSAAKARVAAKTTQITK
jgi:hypothetical protein